jgi:hypothetical protein
MARNPTDEILYDGSRDRTTRLMSACGTFETFRLTLRMSVNGRRPEATSRRQTGANDPKPSWSRCVPFSFV